MVVCVCVHSLLASLSSQVNVKVNMAAEEGKVELEEPTPEELKAMFEGWKVKPDSKKIELHTEDIDDTMCGRLAYAIGHTDHLTQLFLSGTSSFKLML